MSTGLLESQKEKEKSASWKRIETIGNRSYWITEKYTWLKVREGSKEILLSYVYADKKNNCFYVSKDKWFLVKQKREHHTLYEQWEGNPSANVELRNPCDIQSQLHIKFSAPFRCAVYQEVGMNRYRVDWPEEEGGKFYYRPL